MTHATPTLTTRATPPYPGSQAAIDRGCTCPVMDNAYGRGIDDGVHRMHWVNASCRLHGAAIGFRGADAPESGE